MRRLPTISVIVVSYNNERLIPTCVAAIKAQDYPEKLVEYINVDGGSTDGSKRLMAKAGFRVIDSPFLRNAEAQRAVGLQEARHEILAYLDTDNFLPSPSWLCDMTLPFREDDAVVCSQTLRYTYRREDTLFNRYVALFGGSDPVAFYVGRPDRITWAQRKWRLGDSVKDRGTWYRVRFSEANLPTVGCNGILVKRQVLLDHAASRPDQFLHIDVFVDLLRAGYDTFAIVKNDVIHATAGSLHNLLKKRIAFLKYFFRQTRPRRYLIYNSRRVGDNVRLALFVVYTVTIVKPLLDGVRGYLRLRDPAWFVHPLVCWIYLGAYGWATLNRLFTRAPQLQ